MGKRGPQPKPTALKLVQGTPGGKHKLNDNEPKPEAAHGAQPAHELTADGRAIWDTETPKLEMLGLLTTIDTSAFTRYCDIRANWLKAKQFIEEHGLSHPIYFAQTPEEIAAGVPKRLKKLELFAEVRAYLEFGRELSRMESAFGMTPAARAGLSVTPPEGETGQTIEDFLYNAGE